MELSWSTFLLEIINFLILVWILKHFLYQPVLDVLARRRAAVEEKISAARHMNEEAEQLRSEYENRLAVWDQERQQAREVLAQELNEERLRRLEALTSALAQEREKTQAKESRQRTKAQHELEHRALLQGAQFATRLLSQAAGPELEARLLTLLLHGLSALSDDQALALKNQRGEGPEVISVVSAYRLSAAQRQALKEALIKVSGLETRVHFEEDAELLAGLRVTIGSWVLYASIKDDLSGFAEFAHVAY
ncbi:MAG: F0F1 ATP synthase subunit delta [Desulfuromonadales bacterium]|nr:F0F1 ATP synthase subunit delta [Desulfuromonadales bacterium]MBN2792362.1 F0F1 ATP synthase subunit delta [Desulfuromonadales bacterium]